MIDSGWQILSDLQLSPEHVCDNSCFLKAGNIFGRADSANLYLLKLQKVKRMLLMILFPEFPKPAVPLLPNLTIFKAGQA